MSEVKKTARDLLSNLQRNLKAPKSQYNSYGGYHYRSCEDICEAVKEMLPESATLTLRDDMICAGTRFYIKATVTLTYNGEEISNCAYAREAETKKGMDEAQITGSVSSYARKYALAGLLLLDNEKDPDAINKHGKDDTSEKDFVSGKRKENLIKMYQEDKSIMTDSQFSFLKSGRLFNTVADKIIKDNLELAKKVQASM